MKICGIGLTRLLTGIVQSQNLTQRKVMHDWKCNLLNFNHGLLVLHKDCFSCLTAVPFILSNCE